MELDNEIKKSISRKLEKIKIGLDNEIKDLLRTELEK